jgi:hypothetical protein
LALHPHGSALLSVHPKVPAAGDQSVIAACACSVEQATGGIGFALREMWEKKTNRAYKHSFPAHGWKDRLHPRRHRRLSWRSEEVRSDGVSANLLVARADSGVIRRLNFALH